MVDFVGKKRREREAGARVVRRTRQIVLTLVFAFLFSFVPMASMFVVQAASNVNNANSITAADLVSLTKNDYGAQEQPVFRVEVERRPIVRLFDIGTVRRQVASVALVTPDGTQRELRYDQTTSRSGRSTFDVLSVSTDNFSKPGKYSVTFALLEDGQSRIITQDFSWGVLTMNSDKSAYAPNETAQIDMGVLDNSGYTICDAELQLTIVDPSGTSSSRSTTDGSIQRSDECGGASISKLPDYTTKYQVGGVGDYLVTLTATTEAGSHTITDYLYVREDLPFDIARQGPTRLYPGADYDMTFTVVPREDYQGVFEDYVPAAFEIISTSDQGLVSELDQDTKTISWQVDWRAGETYILTYRFDPPNISPAIFILGKAKARSFEEFRFWQIASDATCTASVDGNWNNNATWGGAAQCGGSYPGATTNDIVVINTGINVAANTSITTYDLTSITFNRSTSATDITWGAGITLDVTGAVTIDTVGNGGTTTIAVGTGTLNAGSIVLNGGASGTRYAILTLGTTGTITTTGDVTCGSRTAQQFITVTGNGVINVGGNFVSGSNTCTFEAGTGTVKMIASAADKTLGDFITTNAYNNVEIATTNSRVISTEGATTIDGTLTVTSGTFTKVGAALTVTGATSVTGTIST
ncbi:MAG: hypothetical protein V1916_00995, partial [Patescibacteria group bacterium]